MAKIPQVTWLRAFEAAARHSSFSAAAEELGLTPAAVSQQIRLLEKHLKVTLFERLPRGVVLTDMGQAYAQPIRKSFADMALATRGLFNVSRKRVMHVRASISCAALVIAPRLAEFQNLHPDIDVHLSTFVWADRFGEAQSDVDIRYGHGDWTDGHVTHLGHEFAIPVCHPDYAAAFGKRLSIGALAEREVIKIAGSETDWLRLSEHYGMTFGHPSNELHMDSSLIALQAVIAGSGTALVLERFARYYLEMGLLIAPVEHRLPVRPSHFLVQRSNSDRVDEVRTISDWIMSIYQT